MELGYIVVTLGWQAPMLVGKIGKAFEPSHRRPARDLGKQCRQDRQEYYGEDRGQHRGAKKETERAAEDYICDTLRAQEQREKAE